MFFKKCKLFIRYNDNREEKKLIYLKNMDLRFLEIIVFMSAIYIYIYIYIYAFNICQYLFHAL